MKAANGSGNGAVTRKAALISDRNKKPPKVDVNSDNIPKALKLRPQ